MLISPVTVAGCQRPDRYEYRKLQCVVPDALQMHDGYLGIGEATKTAPRPE